MKWFFSDRFTAFDMFCMSIVATAVCDSGFVWLLLWIPLAVLSSIFSAFYKRFVLGKEGQA